MCPVNETRAEPPSLDVVWDLEYEVWKATALKAALELDVFTTIAEGHRALDGGHSWAPLVIP